VQQHRRIQVVVLPLVILMLITAGSLLVNHLQTSRVSTLQQRVIFVASQVRAPGDPSTVATSSLGDAQNMRFEIEQGLQKGLSTQQVLNLMVAEYGSSVLATPPFRGFGQLVWIAPWFVLAVLLGAVWFFLHRISNDESVLQRRTEFLELSLEAQTQDPGRSIPSDQETVSTAVEERLRDYL